MLVVDANVVAHALVEGDRTEQARKLWEYDPDWRAPRLLIYELTNVFAQLVRQQALTLEAASAALQNGAALVEVLAEEPPAVRTLQIAASLRISAYDASYLAAAEIVGVPRVTEDRRLLRAAPEITRSLSGS